MEDEEDDEEEEHATERRSFASVSTGSACGESSWSSLACRHVVTLSVRQLQTCLDDAELVLGLGAGEHGESYDSELSDDAFLRHQRPAQSRRRPSWRPLSLGQFGANRAPLF